MASRIILLLYALSIFFSTFTYAAAIPSIDERLAQHIHYNPTTFNRIGLINIEDHSTMISEATWLYVKKAIEYYKEKKVILIILKLNTPGGEVFAAQKISDALKELDTQNDIPVIAFIDNWAISAGAMLAYSSRFIAIVKDASMGAAEPIMATQTGEMKEASEKVNSALRADFANRARFFDRNPDIAEAMVDKDIILVWREGKVVRLDSDSQMLPGDSVISAKGKLLTLNSEQMMQYGVADLLLPPAKLDPLTEEEKQKHEWPASKLLLFQNPFFAKIPNAIVDEYQMDWKTRFFVILASPVVSSLLMLGLMLGFYMEMSTPGFGLPGTIAFFCLFCIILSSLSLEIASWLELILLLTGITIVLVDLFVLPTFGLLGIVGLVMAIVGLFAMLLPEIGSVQFDFSTQTWNAAGEAMLERVTWLSGTLVIGFLLMMVLGRYVTPSLAAWSRLVLVGGEQDASQGYIAGQTPQTLPPPGSKGTAFSTLRPSGKIFVNRKIYDALAAGNFIEKDTPITVVRLDGSVIVVDLDRSPS